MPCVMRVLVVLISVLCLQFVCTEAGVRRQVRAPVLKRKTRSSSYLELDSSFGLSDWLPQEEVLLTTPSLRPVTMRPPVSGPMPWYTRAFLGTRQRLLNRMPARSLIARRLTSHQGPPRNVNSALQSALNPANFRVPEMTLRDMEVTLAEIERHTRSKDGNPADYTSSRMLITLLREQCARMRPFVSSDFENFCNQIDARFRSLFF